MLVHAFIASRMDYCNAILAGSPRSMTDKLQRHERCSIIIIIIIIETFVARLLQLKNEHKPTYATLKYIKIDKR